jgi:hypothetical protein
VLPDGDRTDIADAAAQLGSKTLIVTGSPSNVPAQIAMSYCRSSWVIR